MRVAQVRDYEKQTVTPVGRKAAAARRAEGRPCVFRSGDRGQLRGLPAERHGAEDQVLHVHLHAAGAAGESWNRPKRSLKRGSIAWKPTCGSSPGCISARVPLLAANGGLLHARALLASPALPCFSGKQCLFALEIVGALQAVAHEALAVYNSRDVRRIARTTCAAAEDAGRVLHPRLGRRSAASFPRRRAFICFRIRPGG